MKSIFRKGIFLGLMILLSAAGGYAQTDSVSFPADYSLLPRQHVWLRVQNPVAFLGIGGVMDLQAAYGATSGSYKHLTEAENVNGGKVSVEGFKQVGRIHFFGHFSYGISSLKGQKWKDVLMPSPGNPYLLADSIGGDYTNEGFDIRAGMAAPLNEKISVGVSATYQGGTSSDENDPRPLIDAARYSIRPGIVYRFSRWSIGADVGVEGYAESIAIESYQTSSYFTFFQFQGLGNYYPDSGNAHSRRYNGHGISGHIQLGWKKEAFENIFQLGYKNIFEKSEDGSVASPFKSGDYKEQAYSVSDIFTARIHDVIHTGTFSFDYIPSKGIWYDQKPTTNANGQRVWEIFNQSVQYRQHTLRAGAYYDVLKEKDGFADYSLGGNIVFEQQKTSLLPDMKLQKFSNLFASVEGGKTFLLGNRLRLGLNAQAGYRKNLSTKTDFEGIILADKWSYPVSEYLTADYLTGEVAAKLSKQVLLGRLPSTLYIAAKADYTKATLQTSHFDHPHRISISATVGCTF
ncbi:DUF6850 family outer membrane beta-barrel protein [Limibacterium fermenti]|uniref:DUF6850 family outer membrane beta-barrel protein n=1 Tax=Limibacterium fermenti TaxID=3229863 RepID=UPI0026B8F0AC